MMIFFSMARCGITREKEGVLSAVVVVQVNARLSLAVILTLTSDWLPASPSSPEEGRQGSPAALLLRRPGQGGHQQLRRLGGVSKHRFKIFLNRVNNRSIIQNHHLSGRLCSDTRTTSSHFSALWTVVSASPLHHRLSTLRLLLLE